MAKESFFCHVFLSFRGETRDSFTCFLHDALKAEGFEIFMDKEAIRVGDEVDGRIRSGIRGSMSAIVVFSKNFAFSTWCLDELLLILERKKTSRYVIIPIFYEVEPADIKHQLGSYGAALEKHKERHNDKVEKWRQALVEVGNIFGPHFDRMQSNFIQNIVKLFREKLSVEFPECPLPLHKNPVPPSPSSPSDRVVIYTNEPDNVMANTLAKSILTQGSVVFEERNCFKDPRYITELRELVRKKELRFPMVIVNGKDLCGEEEVEGLEGFRLKNHLKATLNYLNTTKEIADDIRNRSSSKWGAKTVRKNGK